MGGIPLNLRGGLQGAWSFRTQIEEERFKEEDLQLLTTLAPQVRNCYSEASTLRIAADSGNLYSRNGIYWIPWLDNTPDQIFFKDLQGVYLRSSNSYARHLHLNSPWRTLWANLTCNFMATIRCPFTARKPGISGSGQGLQVSSNGL